MDAVNYFEGNGRFLIAADLNGDGKIDLATKNLYSGVVSVLLNQGAGTFKKAAVNYAVGRDIQSLIAADLNGDGKPDLAATGIDGVTVLINETTPPFSVDINHNSIPDECEQTLFHRGDPNSSGTTDISDSISIFGFLFLGDPPAISCKESADSNNDGRLDISDGIYLLSWLFTGGPEPAAPGPSTQPCGLDPDRAGGPGDLGCDEYLGCK